MLIAIDGFEASADARVGVGRYEVELLKKLRQIDTKNTYRIYTPKKPTADMPAETQRWQYRIPSAHKLWSQITLPLVTHLDRPYPDVFFSPVHYAPRFVPAPVVLGIMDLSFLFFPDMFKQTDLYKLKNWTAYSVKKAQHIVTISKSSKSDILNQYGIAEERVSVVYPGISDYTVQKTTMNDSRHILQRYGVSGDYLLYVGTLQPRKNIVRLIEAFDLVLKKLAGTKHSKLQLVIVGKKGWLYDTILAKARDLNIDDRVVFTGFVPDEDLPSLYKHARAFCLVSLYEGFGFPVLEAMREETPVIASNVSSLPELVGDAGLLVNPEDTTDIAQGILKLVKITEADRKKMIAKGKKQVAQFTWEKTAKETLEILEKVGNS